MSILDWFRRLKKVKSEPHLVLKQATDWRWVKLVDLPGYREWAADYDRLERIIPHLEDYHLAVPVADLEQPSEGYFEKVFQGKLDAFTEHFAHLDLPREDVADYRRGGKFFNDNA